MKCLYRDARRMNGSMVNVGHQEEVALILQHILIAKEGEGVEIILLSILIVKDGDVGDILPSIRTVKKGEGLGDILPDIPTMIRTADVEEMSGRRHIVNVLRDVFQGHLQSTRSAHMSPQLSSIAHRGVFPAVPRAVP